VAGNDDQHICPIGMFELGVLAAPDLNPALRPQPAMILRVLVSIVGMPTP
jgi:hypothetical protein